MSFMQRRYKIFLVIGIILVLTLISVKYLYILTHSPRESSWPPAPLPPELRKSYDDFLREAIPVFKERNSTLMLPTWLPDGLKPVGVWDEGAGWLVAYSDRNITTYLKAPITIEIIPESERVLSWISLEFLNKEAEHLREHGRNVTVAKIDDFYVKIIWDYPKGFHIDAYIYDNLNGVRYHIAVEDSIHMSYKDFVKMLNSFRPVS